jgi:hypothetical protein
LPTFATVPFTVTVVDALFVPPEPVTVSVYVVVAAGASERLPRVATGPIAGAIDSERVQRLPAQGYGLAGIDRRGRRLEAYDLGRRPAEPCPGSRPAAAPEPKRRSI